MYDYISVTALYKANPTHISRCGWGWRLTWLLIKLSQLDRGETLLKAVYRNNKNLYNLPLQQPLLIELYTYNQNVPKYASFQWQIGA